MDNFCKALCVTPYMRLNIFLKKKLKSGTLTTILDSETSKTGCGFISHAGKAKHEMLGCTAATNRLGSAAHCSIYCYVCALLTFELSGGKR